jgi:hypothetical protein
MLQGFNGSLEFSVPNRRVSEVKKFFCYCYQQLDDDDYPDDDYPDEEFDTSNEWRFILALESSDITVPFQCVYFYTNELNQLELDDEVSLFQPQFLFRDENGMFHACPMSVRIHVNQKQTLLKTIDNVEDLVLDCFGFLEGGTDHSLGDVYKTIAYHLRYRVLLVLASAHYRVGKRSAFHRFPTDLQKSLKKYL